MRYRRANTAGGIYFFTVNLSNRDSTLLVDHIEALRASVRKVRDRHPFEIISWVTLPDHLHALWRLPPDDATPAAPGAHQGRLFKSDTPRRADHREPAVTSRTRSLAKAILGASDSRRDRPAKARRHDSHQSVKHGYAQRAADWPYSSIHRYTSREELTSAWAYAPKSDIDAGERD